MSGLASKSCVPCRGGVPPLEGEELTQLQEQLGGNWQVVDGHHLSKEFSFSDFRQALDFTNEIGEVAELEGHHPDLELSWGRVGVNIHTHAINGLTESDFVLAAKIDQLNGAGGGQSGNAVP